MLKKLTVKDFAVLRGPLESGRQSPENFGGIFIIAIFLQALLVYLEYFFMGYSVYPNREKIFEIHFWITVGLVILSIIYSIPAVYKKSQKIQYLLSILVSQNTFTAPGYILAIFVLGIKESSININVNENSLLTFTQVTLISGLLLIIVTCIRFYILLQKGHYRKGSKKDELRRKLEIGSYIPTATIGGIGLVFAIQYLLRNSSSETDIMEAFLVIVIPLLIYYVMLFILPEQLVILYCKFRFKCFNYNLSGYLYSEDEDMDKKLKKGNGNSSAKI